ncbi:DUF1385 domain-containing protein [bacterium]|nr:DUF1385 domain-containing protein [bacterium]
MSRLTVGGQAVLEGVMMRAPGVMSVAVRRQDGSIVVQKDLLKSPADKYPFLKWPLLRGLLALGQSLALGFKALDFSSAVAMDDIDKEEKRKKGEYDSGGKIIPKGMSLWSLVGIVTFSLVLGIGFFFFLPLYLTELAGYIFPLVKTNTFLYNIVDGIIRVFFLILYIYGISLMPDIRRVFQYHGAEHKAIFAYEAGLELTTENAKQFSTLHPRCGTAFLLTVMLVAIMVFSLIPSTAPLWIKAVCRIAFLPLIAGISFEIIRKSSESDNKLLKLLTKPGLWLQRVTTREPDDQQIEVSIAALQAALDGSDSDQYDLIV